MKIRPTLSLLATAITLCSFAQEEHTKGFDLQAGVAYNQSSGIKNPTGIGMFLKTRYSPNSKLRLGLQVEPTLLADGEYVQESLPPIRGGANYLVNSYLSAGWLLGHRQANEDGKKHPRFSVYTQAIMSTHRVYIGTDDDRERQTYFGVGLGADCDIRRWTFSSSWNLMPGDGIENFVSLNVGYALVKRG